MKLRHALPLALLTVLAGCAKKVPFEFKIPDAGTSTGVTAMSSAQISERAVLTRIAFGSCLKQQDPMPIIQTVIQSDPNLMVLLGDNVYGDVKDTSDPKMPELVAAYNALAEQPDFTALRQNIPLLTTWDDHDYGANDAGGDFVRKKEAEAIFEQTWALTGSDPRRQRPGIYVAKTFGPEGRRVQMIMLDTRYFRDPLTPTDERGAPGKERYVPSTDPSIQMLGAEQEAWLTEVLREPADLRIMVSSIQVIAEGHGWEAWRTMPAARKRLYSIIERSGAKNLVMVSGDRHLGGLYRDDRAVGFPLYELTSSSLNAPQSTGRARRGDTYVEPGPKRLGEPVYDENFGLIDIDWQQRTLTMSLVETDGETTREVRIPIDGTRTVYRQPGSRVQDL
ncbi:MAG: alkaline phosphatase D family protein [Pseudomonadota bacterium]